MLHCIFGTKGGALRSKATWNIPGAVSTHRRKQHYPRREIDTPVNQTVSLTLSSLFAAVFYPVNDDISTAVPLIRLRYGFQDTQVQFDIRQSRSLLNKNWFSSIIDPFLLILGENGSPSQRIFKDSLIILFLLYLDQKKQLKYNTWLVWSGNLKILDYGG